MIAILGMELEPRE